VREYLISQLNTLLAIPMAVWWGGFTGGLDFDAARLHRATTHERFFGLPHPGGELFPDKGPVVWIAVSVALISVLFYLLLTEERRLIEEAQAQTLNYLSSFVRMSVVTWLPAIPVFLLVSYLGWPSEGWMVEAAPGVLWVFAWVVMSHVTH